jgi:hypothetical protein
MNRPNLKSFRILKLVKRWTQGHDCCGALNPASLIETSQQNKRIEWQARFSEFISGLFELAKALEILVIRDISSVCKIHEFCIGGVKQRERCEIALP